MRMAACSREQEEATMGWELFLNALEGKARAGEHDREHRGRLCMNGWRASQKKREGAEKRELGKWEAEERKDWVN